MSGRGWRARYFAFVWAAVQVLSPAASALADGLIARDNASAPQIHVEAPGSKSCPEVHSPDCGVCRYLSTGGDVPQAPALVPVTRAVESPAADRIAQYVTASATLPHGRAPPLV
jgi:hypothetical protein